MYNIEQKIEQIEATRFNNVDAAIKAVGELSATIRHLLCERISHMDGKINESQKHRMLGVASSWNPTIDWTCKPRICQTTIADDSFVTTICYKVTIVSKIDGIITAFFDSLCRAFSTGLLKYNEEALLNALYFHYRNLGNCKGLIVGCDEDRKKLSVEDDLEYLIEMYFRVKLVDCEGRYASGDYFEMDQANVPNPTTTKKALVSADDGVLCLQKGCFVSPLNNNNNDEE